MHPEDPRESISSLTSEQKGLLLTALQDIQTYLEALKDPHSALGELRTANTKLYAGLMGTPLENAEPFSTIMHQISELGIISRTESGVPRPPEFDKKKLIEAVAEARDLLS